MGKSASGKDSIYNEILKQQEFPLSNVVPYTTRPIRSGEIDGESYHFCDEAKVEELEAQGKIIELRTYQTVHGPWRYFTVNDGQIDMEKKNSIIIATLEAYEKIRDYFGAESVVPIYVEVEDGERLARALARERAQESPKYEEMCRRFLADAADFSEEHLKRAGIIKRFENKDMAQTMREIIEYMKNS